MLYTFILDYNQLANYLSNYENKNISNLLISYLHSFTGLDPLSTLSQDGKSSPYTAMFIIPSQVGPLLVCTYVLLALKDYEAVLRAFLQVLELRGLALAAERFWLTSSSSCGTLFTPSSASPSTAFHWTRQFGGTTRRMASMQQAGRTRRCEMTCCSCIPTWTRGIRWLACRGTSTGSGSTTRSQRKHRRITELPFAPPTLWRACTSA